MTREEIIQAINNYMARENAKDYGLTGKKLEVLTRDYLLTKGIVSIEDCRCRSMKSKDCTIKVNGKLVNIEIKTGSGAVAYSTINAFTVDDLIADNVFPNADVIAWYPFSKLALNAPNPFSFGWVFTREQFIECLENIGKRGISSSIHVTKHGGQINIQTLSAKIEDRLYNELEKVPTIQEWKASIREG